MREIVTETHLRVPPDAAWQVLVDAPGHAGWNPFITEMAGEMYTGERIRITLQPPGGKPLRLRPRLLAVQSGRELRWRGSVIVPGLFDGEHYFLLEPDGTGTRFIHGERFTGILVPLLWRSVEAPTRRGFEAMNAALAARLHPSD